MACFVLKLLLSPVCRPEIIALVSVRRMLFLPEHPNCEYSPNTKLYVVGEAYYIHDIGGQRSSWDGPRDARGGKGKKGRGWRKAK